MPLYPTYENYQRDTDPIQKVADFYCLNEG